MLEYSIPKDTQCQPWWAARDKVPVWRTPPGETWSSGGAGPRLLQGGWCPLCAASGIRLSAFQFCKPNTCKHTVTTHLKPWKFWKSLKSSLSTATMLVNDQFCIEWMGYFSLNWFMEWLHFSTRWQKSKQYFLPLATTTFNGPLIT